MKAAFFLRGSWGKKDKKVPTSTTLIPHSEHILQFDAPPSPPSKLPNYDASSFHTIHLDSFLQTEFHLGDGDDTSQSSQGSDGQGQAGRHVSSVDQEAVTYQSRLKLNGNHGALFNTTHGPPQNFFHGPPHFNHSNRSARPNTAPSRPPRPPPLDLYTNPRPMSGTPRSPNRVRFAPTPHIPPPDSPSRHSFRHVGQTKAYAVGSPEDGDTSLNSGKVIYPQLSESRQNTKFEGDSSNAAIIDTPHPPSSSYTSQSPRRMARVVADISDPPLPYSHHHASSSSPHLSLTENKTPSNVSKIDPEHGPSLALFPSPPPLVVRKRPKPLVLPPVPTSARLPPSPSPGHSFSPAISSAGLTPPSTPRPFQSPLNGTTSRKSPIRSLSNIPPLTYSPPNTPLPTPPSFPSATPEIHSYRQLRSTCSTADLRSPQFHPSGGHRATLSTPSPDAHCQAESEPNRGGTQFCPNDIYTSTHLHAEERIPSSTSHSQVQWGYAL